MRVAFIATFRSFGEKAPTRKHSACQRIEWVIPKKTVASSTTLLPNTKVDEWSMNTIGRSCPDAEFPSAREELRWRLINVANARSRTRAVRTGCRERHLV